MMSKRAGSVAARPRGSPPAHRASRMTRADKLEATRKALFAAATRVIGRDGYANASVAKITALADVAQGTFYNYFSSRQDLFDHLLPQLGNQMLDYIRERVGGCTDLLQREELSFRAFFDFLHETPEFYRILNEAEVFAPKAFADHMANMAVRYERSLKKSRARGQLPGYAAEDLEVIVYSLLAARNYLAYRFTYRDQSAVPIPKRLVQAYMRFVGGGLGAGADSGTADVASSAQAPAALADHPPEPVVLFTGEDDAGLKLQLDARHRAGDGLVRRAVLLDLADRAGQLAAATPPATATAVTLSASFTAPCRGSVLIARAHCEWRHGDLAHVGLRVHEQGEVGPVVAIGHGLFAVAPAANGRR